MVHCLQNFQVGSMIPYLNLGLEGVVTQYSAIIFLKRITCGVMTAPGTCHSQDTGRSFRSAVVSTRNLERRFEAEPVSLDALAELFRWPKKAGVTYAGFCYYPP